MQVHAIDPKNFTLTPEPLAGEVPEVVIEELRLLRTNANDAIADYREAVKVQAEKHKLKPSALRKYINALAMDKLDQLGAECVEVVHLIDADGNGAAKAA